MFGLFFLSSLALAESSNSESQPVQDLSQALYYPSGQIAWNPLSGEVWHEGGARAWSLAQGYARHADGAAAWSLRSGDCRDTSGQHVQAELCAVELGSGLTLWLGLAPDGSLFLEIWGAQER